MKTIAIFILVLALLFPVSGSEAKGTDDSTRDIFEPSRIRITFHQQEVIVKMFNNQASRDFMSLLPLTLEFSEYAGAEKIAYLPRRLTTNNMPMSHDATGDFTYYAPWGNLAIFYKGLGSNDQLSILGRIELGKEKLAAMPQVFTARIEKIE